MRRPAAALLLALGAASLAYAQDKAHESDVVRETRKQLSKLRAELAELRGEKLERDVAIAGATEDSLSPESKSEIDRRYDTHADQIARAYARLGLYPRAFRATQLQAAFASGVLAFYDPPKHTFFVVEHDPPLEDVTDTTAIHELDHALQDQRFDLVAYYHFSNDPDPIAANDDAFLARRFVVEGEASYVGWLHDAKKGQFEDKLDALLEKQASFTRQELSHLERKQAHLGGKGALKALDAYDELPTYLYRQLLDPYVKGPAFIAGVRKKGGWKAVDELFTKPPASTKEILHPEKLHAAIDTLELPDLSVVLGGGYKRTFENSFGEIGVGCVLAERALSKKAPDAIARIGATWNGDRFQAYENRARATCALWLTSWETDDAAREFEEAGKEILKTEWSTTADSFVVRREKRVFLALGVPRHREKALVAAVFEAK